MSVLKTVLIRISYSFKLGRRTDWLEGRGIIGERWGKVKLRNMYKGPMGTDNGGRGIECGRQGVDRSEESNGENMETSVIEQQSKNKINLGREGQRWGLRPLPGRQKFIYEMNFFPKLSILFCKTDVFEKPNTKTKH